MAQLSTEEVKRLNQYMVTRRLADAKIAEFLAQGGVGASTSNAPLISIPEAMPNPEENDPIYEALAFPVDAPQGGPSRPFVFPMKGTSPRREGHRGRAHVGAMAEQGPPLDLSDEEMDQPPLRPCRQHDATNIEDPEPTMVRLPTEVQLDEDYIFS